MDELIETNHFMPESFEKKLEMAKVFAASKLLPAAFDTPEKVVIALQMGYELGLSPMVALNNIAVVNGRPALTTDIMLAIIRSNKEFAGLTWMEATNKVATVKVCRSHNGIVEEYLSTFTIEDAAAAKLINKDNWKNYPGRMLKKRALSYALKDAFPDVLAGLYDPEEIEAVSPVNGPTVENLASAAVDTPKAEVYTFEDEDKTKKIAPEKLEEETSKVEKFDTLADVY